MIIHETIIIRGRSFEKTFSDLGLQIRKVGTEELYEEAINIEGHAYSYEETDAPVYGGAEA